MSSSTLEKRRSQLIKGKMPSVELLLAWSLNREGETMLFEVLMRRHNQRLYRTIRSLLKEEAEIAVIEGFLPQQMDEAATRAAVADAVAETGATSVKEMGKVMAVLRAKHAANLDMAKACPLVKSALGG